jgi:serine/threonine protein kinase
MLFAGRYEVIEEVGRGGMGRVYKVFDQKIKETVALKLINPEIGLNEKAIERFRNELRFARKISHRHVCRLYDLGETGFTHFITMEYVEGEDLKRFIKKSGQLTPAKAVSIARQGCEGLAEAHRLGVIHRDLKPQNIMIDRDGNARIMDFGIARFLEGDGVTASGVMMGTPEYTSPEQNELREVDKRADIYSLGVILFEMVTGRVPFEGETPLSIAMKHKSETPRNPHELNPHVSPALADVIIRCLEKDRKKRYQSAEELLAALTPIEQGFPTAERIAPTATAPGRKIIIPALILIIAAVVIIVQLASRRQNTFVIPQPIKTQKPIPPPTVPQEPAISTENVPRGETTKAAEKKSGLDIVGMLGSEAAKYLSQKDLEGLQGGLKDGAQFLEGLKGKLPAGSAIETAWKKTYDMVKQGQQLNKEGKAEEAQKSNQEVQVEMQKLMGLVSQRQSAREAKAKMDSAKIQSEKTGLDTKNLIFRLANYEERSADEAFIKNDYSGAKVLYQILERSYRLGAQCANDEMCTQALREMMEGFKRGLEGLNHSSLDPWLYEYAKQIEQQGNLYQSKKELENAAASYIQAAFLYQKLKEK